METAAARIVFLILMGWIGFRDILSVKLTDLTLSECALPLMTAGLSVAAVVGSGEPLTFYLIPIMILIAFYRLRTLFFKMHTIIASFINPSQESTAFSAGSDDHAGDGAEWPSMGLVLIEKGQICGNNLIKIGKTSFWLRRELRKFGYRDIRQVNYLTIDSLGNFYMDLNKYTPQN